MKIQSGNKTGVVRSERGKRIFGVAGFGVNARRLHDDILEKLKK